MIEDRSQRARVLARFVRNLRTLRDRAGLSQEDAAILAGLHRTEISLLERYERMPRAETLVRIFSVLESDAWDLLDGLAWDLYGRLADPRVDVDRPTVADSRGRRAVADPWERFGLLLTRERLRARLRQDEVGWLVQMHRAEISLMERGGRQPRLDVLLQLAAAVETRAPELLDGIHWIPGEIAVVRGGYVVRAEQLVLEDGCV
jgi:transcriptional regulator with XRE-family HTH domain